ncbi:MAG: TetR family transcriptional regulator [Myxococcota bacterium]
MKAANRAPLDEERIVQASLELLESRGIDGFSIRKLGARLGVTPMSLYHYFDDRDAILRAVVDSVLLSVEIAPRGRGSWQHAVRKLLRSLHEQLLPHVALLPLLSSAEHWSPALLRVGHVLFEIVEESGCSPGAAVKAHRILMHHTFGSLMIVASDPDPGAERRASLVLSDDSHPAEQRERLQSMFRLAREAADNPGRDFDVSLGALIAGLEHTILRKRR